MVQAFWMRRLCSNGEFLSLEQNFPIGVGCFCTVAVPWPFNIFTAPLQSVFPLLLWLNSIHIPQSVQYSHCSVAAALIVRVF